MATVVRDDDFLVVHISVHYPSWLDEVSSEEFDNIMMSAEKKAINEFSKQLVEAQQYWKARKMASLLGQTDIYDYV